MKMTKVKKETKMVIKSPAQKVKKLNKKPLKKKPLKEKSKELQKKIIKALNENSIEEKNSADVQDNLNYDKLNIDLNQIRKGVEALLQYTEKHKSKDLFKGQQQVFVQITCIRIPKGANRKFRIKLQHPLITIDNEICLIVPDLKRGRKVDHEETVEHYEDLLRSKNVNYIKRILPMRQLRVEYDQFELKRRLCGYYDYFLVDGRISGHALHILGKTFSEKRKQPVPIQMNSTDLNNVILKAMSKTELKVHSNGDTYIVQIGHTDMPVENIVDNLKVIINSISMSFPGNWQNIRSLHVKTDKSIAIPVYYTLKDSNKVSPPSVKAPKLGEIITDELSTRRHSVTVHPDGRVVLNDPVSKRKIKQIKQAKKTKRSSLVLKNKIKRNKKNIGKKSKVDGNSPKKIKTEQNGKVKTETKSEVKVKKETKSEVKVKKTKSEVKVKKETKSEVKVKKESPKKIKIEKQ